MRRIARRAAWVVAILVVLQVVATPLLYPALAAAVCPSCYGMERFGESLIVEKSMSVPERRRVRRDLQSARDAARKWFERPDANAIVVACASEECDRRLGGRGARATTYGTPFATVIRVGPRGLGRTILLHEFAHVAFHRHVGLVSQITGGLPAWFDEGLAVIVSRDERYVWPDGRARNCDAPDPRPLPEGPFEWAARAGREQDLYARAACRVDAWLQVNGGRAGVLARLRDGGVFP